MTRYGWTMEARSGINAVMANDKSFPGSCFCGAVGIAVTGEPVAMGYCHCRSCRWWSAGPVNGFTLWKPSSVKVTKGETQLGVFHKTETSHRQFCRVCGGHVMTAHPTFDLVDVYAAVIPEFPFAPKLHVHYGENVLAVRDGLPKFRDMPKEMGGSGVTLSE